VSSLVVFALSLISLGTKSSQQEQVSTAASFISEKIKYEIRNASDINMSTSNFGVNLADPNNKGDSVSLAESGSNNPAVFNVAGGNAQLTLGAGAVTALNSSDVQITNLTFTNLSSANGSSKNLRFTLTITSIATSPGNIHESTTLEGDAELRSNE
jgi:hypothetical protein